MDNTWIGFLVVVLTVLGSNVWLHRDIASLREPIATLEARMSRLEGIMEGFMAGQKTG